MSTLHTLADRAAEQPSRDNLSTFFGALVEAVERLEVRAAREDGDLMAGISPLPPVSDLMHALLENVARVPNEVPAWPSTWSFAPDERKVG